MAKDGNILNTHSDGSPIMGIDGAVGTGQARFLRTDASGYLVASIANTVSVAQPVSVIGGDGAAGDQGGQNPVYIQGYDKSNSTTNANPVLIGATDGSKTQSLQVDSGNNLKTAVRRATTALTNISTTYNNITTTATSGSVDCSMYRRAKFYWNITKANTPTDITVVAQMSYDNSTWFDYRRNWWVKYRFSTAAVGSGLSDVMDLDLLGSYLRFVVTATGTSASNTFTVANANVEVID